MARDLGPKCRQCRREGEKLFLKGEKCFTTKCPIVKRNYPPGMHGVKSFTRQSEYGLQLREKQKAKRIYGILERQFENYYASAVRKAGNTADVFAKMLEMRLDTIVRRMGIAPSQGVARQFISHGHILVNGKRMTIPSAQMRVGNVVSVSEKSMKMKYFQERTKQMEKAETPAWLTLDPKKLTGTVKAEPATDEIKQNIDMKLIVEYYSR